MLLYLKHLKRIFTPRQFPLFRTVKLRYIFLHLLIIAILFSIPASIKYFKIIQTADTMVGTKQSEIPDFTIKNNHLQLTHEQSIQIKPYTIQFKKEKAQPKKNMITFDPDGIQLDQSTFLSYDNIPVFDDRQSLIAFLKSYTSSSYFFLTLITCALIFIQYITTIIKIIFISGIAHSLARLAERKSRFMNWLKISTFIITLPSVILFIGTLNIFQSLFVTISWLLICLYVLLTIRYLPAVK